MGIARFHLLGNFTNHAEQVLPILVDGLTNAGSVSACIDSLQRFGAIAVPSIYRVAKLETGTIRPAEVALEKIDPALYRKLREDKAKSEVP